MRKLNIASVVFVLSLLVACGGAKEKKQVDTTRPIPIVAFEGVRPLLEKSNDTTYVINFWATWCAPCVKELPHLEKIAEEFSSSKLKVILINLDFPNHYDTRLMPFVEEKQIKSQIVMLDDPDANRWINQVDPNWTGSIPATIIYNKNKRKFYEKEFTYDELKTEVLSFLN